MERGPWEACWLLFASRSSTFCCSLGHGAYTPAFLDMSPCLLASLSTALAPCPLLRPGKAMPSPSLAPSLKALFNGGGWF